MIPQTLSPEFSHFPVMLDEVIKICSPNKGGIYIDCTFGGGGYSKKLLKFSKTKVIALDRDEFILDASKELENKISTFLDMEDTILYAAAFDANGGLFEPLLNHEDVIISDELNHASIIDGIRLCKAKRLRYSNNNMQEENNNGNSEVGPTKGARSSREGANSGHARQDAPQHLRRARPRALRPRAPAQAGTARAAPARARRQSVSCPTNCVCRHRARYCCLAADRARASRAEATRAAPGRSPPGG